MLGLSAISYAQSSETAIEYGRATIDANYCLVLDNTTKIGEFYAADASDLNWTSEADATKKCGFHTNNLVTYTQDFANGRILIQIHNDRTPVAHDILWWNEYLQSICK